MNAKSTPETTDFSNVIITGINRVVTVRLHANYSRANVDRPSQGIIITTEGCVRYTYRNRSYIGDPKHVLLLSKGISYSFFSMDESTSVVINFNTAETFPLNGICSCEMDVCLKAAQIDNLWTFHKNAYPLKIMSSLYSFLAKQSRDSTAYIPSQKLNDIAPSIAYIEKHYTEPGLNNEILAQQSDVSTVYFRKLFARAYGTAPMQYVRRKRIERAKNLLASDYGISITEVAEAAGFTSVYRFSRLFHQYTSSTPSQYRRRKRDGLGSSRPSK